MSALRALFGAHEERTITAASLPLGEWAGDNYASSWAGVSVTSVSAMQLSTVWGCVKFICDGISTLPVDVYRKVNGVSVEAPKPSWLEQPTAYLDRVAWVTQVLSSLLISGNAFCEIRRSNAAIAELVPYDPTKVTVRFEGGRKVFDVGTRRFTSFDMLHIAGPMAPGALIGMSPLEAARQTIGAGLAADEFAARFFGQGLAMSGVIEVPGQLDTPQAKVLANSMRRAHGGKSKAHLPGVLSGGAKWTPTSVTADQAQFLQTRKFTDSQIAGRIFNLDPTELGIPLDGTTLTYQNALDRTIRKVEVTFLPWIVRLENAWTSLLPQPRYAKLNVDALKRGDIKTRFEVYASGIASGVLLPDEARELEDLPPLPLPLPPPAPVPVAAAPVPPTTAAVKPEPPVTNNYFTMPELRVEAPQVTVNVPEQRVEAPIVNVTLPATEPIVVPAPNVTIEQPRTTVTRDVQRDEKGQITRIVEA